MSARWAQPVIPLGVEEDAGRSLVFWGRRWDFPSFILSHDDVERVRLGYVCIKCLEQHAVPYPRQCIVCGFPMRDIQNEVFAKFYEGEQKVGPQTTLAEEMQIAQEIVDRGS